LRELRLDSNQVNDISPLANLRELRVLFISRNKVENISVLAQLTQLNELDLANNPVTDIKPLARLQRLRSVSLQGSKVTNLKPLGALPTLREVKLIGIAMLAVPEIRKLQNDLPKLNISHNATSTYIRFTNKTRQPILISWVNHSGKLETFDIGLQPNGTRQQGTYVGHEWAISTPAGREIGRTFASSHTTDWLITAQGLKSPSRK